MSGKAGQNPRGSCDRRPGRGVGSVRILGSRSLANLSIGEVPGKALKVPAKVFQEAIEEFPELNRRLQLYTQALFVLVAQVLACNTLRSMDERSARRILMTHDRVHRETLPLTQEILARMLGVRRLTVALAAGMLKKAGLIQYSHGYRRSAGRLKRSACRMASRREHKYGYRLDHLSPADEGRTTTRA